MASIRDIQNPLDVLPSPINLLLRIIAQQRIRIPGTEINPICTLP